jgi:enterochelin esterase-like enzyme
MSSSKNFFARVLHAGAGLFDWVRSAPRALPIASAVLVGLLLLDAMFIIARSSSPRGAMADVLAFAPTQAAQATVAATKPPAKLKKRILPTTTPIPAIATADAQMAQLMALPTSDACPNPIGKVLTETVQSKVVGGPMAVNVYLPPCYRPDRFKYPTLYLIQGNNHEIGGWIDIGVTRIANMQMSLGMIPPFIIVMPANGQYGRNPYTWSWKGPTSYEGFLVNELVPFIDGKFATWKERTGRAIGGISRGGYWSIQVAFANPDKFSIIGAHSPSITDKLIGAGPGFTMLSMAKTVTDVGTLRIWIDAGNRDWAQKDAKKLAADLDKIQVSYQLSFGEGPHDDPTWAARVADYLSFYSSQWPRLAKTNTQAVGVAKP